MMTLANYGLKSGKHKDPNSAKSLSKSLQIRNRAELALKHCLRAHFRLPDDKRNDIISSLEEYYSRVPFNVTIWNKFQVKQCIVDSILLLDSSFNPYKARQALKVVEDMLINLIYLPWHKEFTRISTYSGRFRQIVSDPLVGIEEVFEAAGFEQAPEDSTMNLVLPESGLPQNDEMQSVTSVIFDCMLAQVVLTDVIDVFEGCCKSAKQSVSDLADDDINCYTWIQAYFRERSHLITDKARSETQEFLNNVTNHLTRQKITAAKSLSSLRSERSTDATPRSRESTDTPDRVAPHQQQLRRHPQTKTIEHINSLRIADDLLKIPDNNDIALRKQYTSGNEDFRSANVSTHQHIPASVRHQPSVWRESAQTSSYNHRQQPVASARLAAKPGDTSGVIDSHMRTESPRTMSYDSMNQPVRADLPHNDRELLIPRPDRRYVAHENQPVNRGGSHLMYRSHTGSYADCNNQHTLGSTSKYQYDPMSAYEARATSQRAQDLLKNSSSKYNSPSNGKYELDP